MPEEVKATFVFRNETKGAYRYYEVNDEGEKKEVTDEDTIVGTLYVRKAGFGAKAEKLTITIVKE